MKTILLSILALSINAQIQIVSFSPQFPCRGDSLAVKAVGIQQGGFQINLISPTTSAIYSFNHAGGDTVSIKLKVNNTLASGPSTIELIQVGNGKTKADVSLCDAVGISEFHSSNPDPIYFDLNGIRVNKSKNVILIEQRGLIRKKVIYLQ